MRTVLERVLVSDTDQVRLMDPPLFALPVEGTVIRSERWRVWAVRGARQRPSGGVGELPHETLVLALDAPHLIGGEWVVLMPLGCAALPAAADRCASRSGDMKDPVHLSVATRHSWRRGRNVRNTRTEHGLFIGRWSPTYLPLARYSLYTTSQQSGHAFLVNDSSIFYINTKDVEIKMEQIIKLILLINLKNLWNNPEYVLYCQFF